MADSASKFPQEIITEILLRLPVKTIGKARCVSKPWCTLLTSPEFIKNHLARRNRVAQENLLLLSSSQSLFDLTLQPDCCISRKLNSREENFVTLVGSCNGLVLVVTEEDCKLLINPTTSEYAALPNSPMALDPRASFSMHGFGFDCSSNDYKIVTLSYYDTDNEHEPDCADTFVDIYSVKMRSWRRLAVSPYDHAVPTLSSGVFLKGSLHWMASKSSDYSSVIAAFNLGSEKFEEIPPPASLDKDKFVFNSLAVLKDCLAIVVELYNDAKVDLWFMNEYGLAESWTKITIGVESVTWVAPLCFCRDELLILVEEEKNLRRYHPDDDRWDDLTIEGDGDEFVNGVPFFESLVSPHFQNYY